MSLSPLRISAVVPVYNEAENIESLIKEIDSTLKSHAQYEMIFVDDGSQDNTVEALHRLQKNYPHLVVVEHKKNYGQSASIVSGVRHASMDWIVTMDGDGQNDPADIPKLAAALKDKSGLASHVLVTGNRTMRRDSFVKRLSSRIANKIRVWLLKDDCPDTGCSLKLFPREAFLQLPHFNHCHRYLPALFKRSGLTVINVPVNHRPRTRGQSKYGIANRLPPAILDLIGVIWLIRRPCQPDILRFTKS